MKINKLITRKGLIFLLIFSFLVFIGDRINFSKLIGAENQFFTLFQFFGPIAGAFLGPVVGVLAVLIAEFGSFIMLGKAWTAVNLLRLLPMLFAAYYFGAHKDKISKNNIVTLLIPFLAILLFIAHPVGRTVWFFTLYWTIPIIIRLLPKKYSEKLFLRSLGSTFTAHAVGGAIWIWTVKMTAQQWIALIPVVAYERLLFAGGIVVSYIAINTLLDKLDAKFTTEVVDIDARYILFKKLLRANV